MEGEYKILILEATSDDGHPILHALSKSGLQYTTRHVDPGLAFDEALNEFSPDIIFSGFAKTSFDGLPLLQSVQKIYPDVPVLFLSDTIEDGKPVKQLNPGTKDCVNNSTPYRLMPDIFRALRESRKQVSSGQKKPETAEGHCALFLPWPLGSAFITGQMEAQQRITRLHRVYRMLRKINLLIVNSHNRQDLFKKACNIAAEEGEFSLAWIGTLPAGESIVVPQASAGHETGYLRHLHVSADKDNPETSDASSLALCQKRSVVFNNINAGEEIPWKKEALNRGYRSLIALPLVVKGQAMGVMTLYASEPDYFDEEEIKLLGEVADDISYAIHNITQQEKLDYLASYDPLTGLPNRLLFHEQLNYILTEAGVERSGVAVLICDLRQFHHINNVFGQQIADMVLREVGIRLQELSNPEHIGRIANDHFAVILPDASAPEEIGHMVENILFPSLQQPIEINKTEVQINFTGGIAISPGDGEDAETLYRNAEAALKKAKSSCEQYLFYRREMTAQMAASLYLENRLRRALKEDQFVLHYQPMIDTQTREITGLEALIRWNDPESGLVPPAQFIPVLEESGLILDVGIWTLHKAAADYRKWCKQLQSVPPIAVNVSPLQLRQNDFVEQVKKAVGGSEIPVSLDIEITENLIMTDIKQNIARLRELQSAGIGIVVDDFGTGYSSLSYIAKLPINSLKIDRSFIANMITQPESMTIVATIITLAHSLNLKVIAEGVETREQAKLLRLLKCDEMQGFLFSKPLPAEDISVLLSENNKL